MYDEKMEREGIELDMCFPKIVSEKKNYNCKLNIWMT